MTNGTRAVIRFLRENIFACYGMFHAIINNQRIILTVGPLMLCSKRYSIIHHLATPYHSQTNNQVEVSDHQIKHTLEKTMNKNSMAFETPLCMSPYRVVHGCPCHLLVKLEH